MKTGFAVKEEMPARLMARLGKFAASDPTGSAPQERKTANSLFMSAKAEFADGRTLRGMVVGDQTTSLNFLSAVGKLAS